MMNNEPIMDDEYEEISVEEVDRVVAALDQMIQSVESETIRAYLEATAEEISYLIDDEEESEGSAAA
ncbi:hypothetical protein K2X85_10950 [bacterium]|jgi:hypothetical protein|nr:hypothetical protein [bacterium]